MFISVTFRILSFRTLPFIPQKKSALNFPQITRSQLSGFRILQNNPSRRYRHRSTSPYLPVSVVHGLKIRADVPATNTGRGWSKKRRDDGTDDGTLSRPRICKPLYGPSQSVETGDWTDDGIGLLHVIPYTVTRPRVVQSATCPVREFAIRELAYPRVVQLPTTTGQWPVV